MSYVSRVYARARTVLRTAVDRVATKFQLLLLYCNRSMYTVVVVSAHVRCHASRLLVGSSLPAEGDEVLGVDSVRVEDDKLAVPLHLPARLHNHRVVRRSPGRVWYRSELALGRARGKNGVAAVERNLTCARARVPTARSAVSASAGEGEEAGAKVQVQAASVAAVKANVPAHRPSCAQSGRARRGRRRHRRRCPPLRASGCRPRRAACGARARRRRTTWPPW